MNMKRNNILFFSSFIIILMTLIFYFSQNISSEYFVLIAEIVITILTLISISVGILVKKNILKFNIPNSKLVLVFLLVFNATFFGLYLYYINKLKYFENLNLETIMSIIVGLFSLGLLIKIKYDIENKVT